ncbi:MAG: acetylglutamate kinase [Endomicrobiia bacterium]
MRNIILVKVGGNVLSSKRKRITLLKTLAKLKNKYSVVFVHGGKSQINSDIKSLNKKVKFINGQRYTDEETLKAVENALSQLNHRIVCELNNLKVKAVGVCGIDGNIFQVQRIKKLGLVGKINKVKTDLIISLLKGNYLPVISPICASNRILNVNAESVAGALASALKCEKLIYISDVPGIMDNNGNLIKEIKTEEIPKLKRGKIVKTGMIPKIESCYSALKKGVKEVYITNELNFFPSKKFKLSGTRIVLS